MEKPSDKAQVMEEEMGLRCYLRARYAGVFDNESLENHIRDYVGFGFANQVAPLLANQIPAGGKVLDIGAGFGSFVLAARRLGLDAVGIEIAKFEVEYARRRLQREKPDDDPQSVYLLGDGLALPFKVNTFDAVTLWNVLEHVADERNLLSESKRVLRPGGCFYIICPNYAAFRKEAHYQVFWPPLMPRKIASIYLRIRKKDLKYFETNIFYRTNWGMLNALFQLGMEVGSLDRITKLNKLEMDTSLRPKIFKPELIQDPRKRALIMRMKKLHFAWLVWFGLLGLIQVKNCWLWKSHITRKLSLYNPFKDSVILSARKGKD
jgi:SAM-dependent methyltransferase